MCHLKRVQYLASQQQVGAPGVARTRLWMEMDGFRCLVTTWQPYHPCHSTGILQSLGISSPRIGSYGAAPQQQKSHAQQNANDQITSPAAGTTDLYILFTLYEDAGMHAAFTAGVHACDA